MQAIDERADLLASFIKQLRSKAKEFEAAAQAKRREARELELRAGEQYDAFISFDLLADKMEQQMKAPENDHAPHL